MIDRNPWEQLADAIVLRACDDYRVAVLDARRRPKDKRQQKRKEVAAFEMEKLEHFFRSDWFSLLSDLDGDYLIKEIRKQAKRRPWYRPRMEEIDEQSSADRQDD